MLDLLTRFARAQREVGLAVGEPPRGTVPPSVFGACRASSSGPASRAGRITALYTVLVAGKSDEPVADEVRGLLVGHPPPRDRRGRALSRGRRPPQPLPRPRPRSRPPGTAPGAHRLRPLPAADERRSELISIGAYARGSRIPTPTTRSHRLPAVEAFLRQRPTEAEELARDGGAPPAPRGATAPYPLQVLLALRARPGRRRHGRCAPARRRPRAGCGTRAPRSGRASRGAGRRPRRARSKAGAARRRPRGVVAPFGRAGFCWEDALAAAALAAPPAKRSHARRRASSRRARSSPAPRSMRPLERHRKPLARAPPAGARRRGGCPARTTSPPRGPRAERSEARDAAEAARRVSAPGRPRREGGATARRARRSQRAFGRTPSLRPRPRAAGEVRPAAYHGPEVPRAGASAGTARRPSTSGMATSTSTAAAVATGGERLVGRARRGGGHALPPSSVARKARMSASSSSAPPGRAHSLLHEGAERAPRSHRWWSVRGFSVSGAGSRPSRTCGDRSSPGRMVPPPVRRASARPPSSTGRRRYGRGTCVRGLHPERRPPRDGSVDDGGGTRPTL